MVDSFLQYAETLQERGTAIDMSRSCDDLLARARTLQEMSFTRTTYSAPAVAFTPCCDVEQLMTFDDDNVIGRITALSRSEGDNNGKTSS